MLLAQDAMLVSPANLLAFLGNMGVNQLHFPLSFSPFCLGRDLDLVVYLCIVLNVLDWAPVLTG